MRREVEVVSHEFTAFLDDINRPDLVGQMAQELLDEARQGSTGAARELAHALCYCRFKSSRAALMKAVEKVEEPVLMEEIANLLERQARQDRWAVWQLLQGLTNPAWKERFQALRSQLEPAVGEADPLLLKGSHNKAPKLELLGMAGLSKPPLVPVQSEQKQQPEDQERPEPKLPELTAEWRVWPDRLAKQSADEVWESIQVAPFYAGVMGTRRLKLEGWQPQPEDQDLYDCFLEGWNHQWLAGGLIDPLGTVEPTLQVVPQAGSRNLLIAGYNRLWSLDTGEALDDFQHFCFAPNGRLAFRGQKGVGLTGRKVSAPLELATFQDGPMGLLFAPDGELLVSVEKGEVRMLDATTLRASSSRPNQMMPEADWETIYREFSQHDRFFDDLKGTPQTRRNFPVPVTGLAFVNDGQTLLLAQANGAIAVLNRQGEQEREFAFPDWRGGLVRIRGYKNRIAAADNSKLLLGNLRDGVTNSQQGWFLDFLFSPEGNLLTIRQDGSVWSLGAGAKRLVAAHSGVAALSPNGRRVAVVRRCHWSVLDSRGELLAEGSLAPGPQVLKIRFSADSQALVVHREESQVLVIWSGGYVDETPARLGRQRHGPLSPVVRRALVRATPNQNWWPFEPEGEALRAAEAISRSQSTTWIKKRLPARWAAPILKLREEELDSAKAEMVPIATTGRVLDLPVPNDLEVELEPSGRFVLMSARGELFLVPVFGKAPSLARLGLRGYVGFSPDGANLVHTDQLKVEHLPLTAPAKCPPRLRGRLLNGPEGDRFYLIGRMQVWWFEGQEAKKWNYRSSQGQDWGKDETLESAALSPQGCYLAVVRGDGRLLRLCAESGEVTSIAIGVLPGTLAISDDGATVVLSSDSLQIFLNQVPVYRSSRPVLDFRLEEDRCLYHDQEGVWEWRSGQGSPTIILPTPTMRAAAFSPDGRYLAGVTRLGQLEIRHLARGLLLCRRNCGFQAERLIYSADGQTLAAYGENRLEVWKAGTLRPEHIGALELSRFANSEELCELASYFRD